MRNRLSDLLLRALALAVFLGLPVPVTAEDVDKTIEGKVTSIKDDHTLVMTNLDGKQITYTVAKGVKITIDGKNVALKGFEPGMRIRVTPDRGDRGKVTRIEGLRFNKDF